MDLAATSGKFQAFKAGTVVKLICGGETPVAGDATGQLRFDAAAGMLLGSIDADADAEFAALLVGVTSLSAQALIL